MGGVGPGTSWFDAPAQPYYGMSCNVFGKTESCCSEDWVMNNVDNDLWTTQDLISPDNTGCMDAMESLHCIVCSPDQATFLSEKKGTTTTPQYIYSLLLYKSNTSLLSLSLSL